MTFWRKPDLGRQVLTTLLLLLHPVEQCLPVPLGVHDRQIVVPSHLLKFITHFLAFHMNLGHLLVHLSIHLVHDLAIVYAPDFLSASAILHHHRYRLWSSSVVVLSDIRDAIHDLVQKLFLGR